MARVVSNSAGTDNNYLAISSPSSVLTGLGIPMTMSIWFNPTSGGSASAYDPVFIIRDGSNNAFGTIAYGGAGAAKRVAWYFGNSNLDPGTATLSYGTWYNLVGTQTSGGALVVYVNAVSDGSASNSGGTFTASNWGIGRDSGFTTRPSNATFADAAVWNVVLSTNEIAALSNGARAYTIRPTALKGYWPLDGIQSSEPDLSGNINSFGLNGTVTLAFNPPVMMLSPRMPLNITGTVAAAAAFQPAWAMRNRIVVEGIGI